MQIAVQILFANAHLACTSQFKYLFVNKHLAHTSQFEYCSQINIYLAHHNRSSNMFYASEHQNCSLRFKSRITNADLPDIMPWEVICHLKTCYQMTWPRPRISTYHNAANTFQGQLYNWQIFYRLKSRLFPKQEPRWQPPCDMIICIIKGWIRINNAFDWKLNIATCKHEL